MTTVTQAVLALVDRTLGVRAQEHAKPAPRGRRAQTPGAARDPELGLPPQVVVRERTELAWSDEASELLALLEKERSAAPDQPRDAQSRRVVLGAWAARSGRVAPELTADMVLALFRSVQLVDAKVTELGADLATRMRALENLSLTGNQLTSVSAQALPPSLHRLDLGANELAEFPRVSSLAHLLHLGLAANRIQTLPAALPVGRQLVSLDLSSNALANLDATVEALAMLPGLQLLCLFGNPLCLLSRYRSTCVSRLDALTLFDNEPVGSAERSAGKRGMSASLVLEETVAETADDQARLQDCAHLHVRALSLSGSSLSPALTRGLANGSDLPPLVENVYHCELSLSSVAPPRTSATLVTLMTPAVSMGVDSAETAVLADAELHLKPTAELAQGLADGLCVSLVHREYTYEPRQVAVPAPAVTAGDAASLKTAGGANAGAGAALRGGRSQGKNTAAGGTAPADTGVSLALLVEQPTVSTVAVPGELAMTPIGASEIAGDAQLASLSAATLAAATSSQTALVAALEESLAAINAALAALAATSAGPLAGSPETGVSSLATASATATATAPAGKRGGGATTASAVNTSSDNSAAAAQQSAGQSPTVTQTQFARVLTSSTTVARGLLPLGALLQPAATDPAVRMDTSVTLHRVPDDTALPPFVAPSVLLAWPTAAVLRLRVALNVPHRRTAPALAAVSAANALPAAALRKQPAGTGSLQGRTSATTSTASIPR